MLEDQRFILEQICAAAQEEQPDGILIAGDLYDKSMPSAEAVELADWFLYRLTQLKIPVWVVSGNHDCAERIAYGGRMMEQSGLYMSRVFDGTLQKYTLTKGKTEADIYLLPFVRPAQVRRFFPERTIETTQQAVEAILETAKPDHGRINILVMHQFLAGAETCESEELSVGGSDQVDVSLLEAFDYVALGHLHRPQKVGRETVRYCGSPLKYSFSEAGHVKSLTVVETPKQSDGDCTAGTASVHPLRVRTILLHPRHDLRTIRGPIVQLLSPEVYRAADTQDYLHITLTDQNEILDAVGKLREVYPNLMQLEFEAGSASMIQEEEIQIEEKTMEELFEEFFVLQNGREMSEEQRCVVREVWRKDGGNCGERSAEKDSGNCEERSAEKDGGNCEERSAEKGSGDCEERNAGEDGGNG